MPYPCDTCRNKKQYQGNINPQKGNCNMLKTFRIGGIHPKENKLTSQCPVTAIPVPRQVSLMLNQHIGKWNIKSLEYFPLIFTSSSIRQNLSSWLDKRPELRLEKYIDPVLYKSHYRWIEYSDIGV
jgi:hypothetical protein